MTMQILFVSRTICSHRVQEESIIVSVSCDFDETDEIFFAMTML